MDKEKNKEKPSITEKQNSGKTNRIVRKVYGVDGLMSWQIQIPLPYDGYPPVTICFEGGRLTGYGVTPARYVTEDPVIQKLIEGSHWFRTGKIFLMG